MTPQLALEVNDYRSDAAWRWVLSDADGRFLADHEVKLDPADPLYRGFADLPGYLRYHRDARPEEETLNELGAWMGANVFGRMGEKLLSYEQRPARVVLVRVPAAAQELLFRPLELAHLGGRPLVERGFRFIYTLADPPSRPTDSKVITGSLRFLAVFSLPRDASPLNLRRERYEIQRHLRCFAQTRGAAVEVRVIQYGATHKTLKEALEEDPGWDVIHFSGHGDAGELLLERADGRLDRITTGDLAELLQPTKARLKLLTLSACYSGAADLNAARRMIGLAAEPRRAGVDVGADVPSAPASIDPFTEWQIQQALNLILKNATSILIAHRLSTVKAADRIVVMQKGAIIEEGNHDGLLARGGHYAELYNTYFRHQSLAYVEQARELIK